MYLLVYCITICIVCAQLLIKLDIIFISFLCTYVQFIISYTYICIYICTKMTDFYYGICYRYKKERGLDRKNLSIYVKGSVLSTCA